tara:strand:+ start:64 stop:924 length:861 start_codon:yes stop_codon:yes gene_type:complete
MTTEIENTKEIEKKQKKNWLVEWVKYKNKPLRLIILLLLIIFAGTTSFIIGYYSFLNWLPSLWNWGFDPLTWRSILSFFGAIYLILFPFLPIIIVENSISEIFKIYAIEAESEYIAKLNEIEKKQSNYENILEKNDTEGLIPLITYSRIELEQYHRIGLNQTQKSYRYSIISMWIGFLIIAFGIITYIIPNKYINPDLIGGNFQVLTIASGIITELISALFLWIYKSSISRLTYFYNRQVFIHNALFAYKISNTMKESDSAKKIIVEKILEFGIASNKESLVNIKE